MAPNDVEKDFVLAEYNQVVAQFRALMDIRFKLLAYLPLGTVAGVFLSKDGNLASEPAIAVFAFIATLCIATYNKRNDQHYDKLVARAAELERENLGLKHGSFLATTCELVEVWLGDGRTPLADWYALRRKRSPLGIYCGEISGSSLLAANDGNDHIGTFDATHSAGRLVNAPQDGIITCQEASKGDIRITAPTGDGRRARAGLTRKN